MWILHGFTWFYPEQMRSSPENSGDFSQQKDDFDGFYHTNWGVKQQTW